MQKFKLKAFKTIFWICVYNLQAHEGCPPISGGDPFEMKHFSGWEIWSIFTTSLAAMGSSPAWTTCQESQVFLLMVGQVVYPGTAVYPLARLVQVNMIEIILKCHKLNTMNVQLNCKNKLKRSLQQNLDQLRVSDTSWALSNRYLYPCGHL